MSNQHTASTFNVAQALHSFCKKPDARLYTDGQLVLMAELARRNPGMSGIAESIDRQRYGVAHLREQQLPVAQRTGFTVDDKSVDGRNQLDFVGELGRFTLKGRGNKALTVAYARSLFEFGLRFLATWSPSEAAPEELAFEHDKDGNIILSETEVIAKAKGLVIPGIPDDELPQVPAPPVEAAPAPAAPAAPAAPVATAIPMATAAEPPKAGAGNGRGNAQR